MVQNVFSLYKIAGEEDVKFPFSIKDYQRYAFGDDRLAHTFGTDLAKAFVVHSPGAGGAQDTKTTRLDEPTNDVTVAVLSGRLPTATHNLRGHFAASLSRHLVSNNRPAARKIDLIRAEDGYAKRSEPRSNRSDTYHIDTTILGQATLVVLGDIRMCDSQEEAISSSLRSQNIDNPIVFGYLACAASTNTSALSSTLSTIVSPSIKDIDNLAHSRYFSMTEACARFILGQGYNEFCRFLRGQDDFFARKLLDFAIGGKYHEDELYRQNYKFLQWEIDARESI
jgi:hypothetical protein